MAYKLGVLVIHGMGEQPSDFADGLIEEVSDLLGGKADSVRWKPVWWAHVLAEAESTLLRDLNANNDLDWTRLRRFVIHALGDAVAYQRVPDGAARVNVYEKTHETVAQALHDLRNKIREGVPEAAPEVPLVVVAHSLGCHIVSNHIWDLQRPQNPRQPVDDNPFERAQTVAGMVTFGCNIPLFTLAYNKTEPITFPPKDLAQWFPPGISAAKLKEAAKWINLYDPDDILGYPLKPLSASYGQTVSEDRPINSGGLIASWNPAAHNAYWTDNDVTKPIAGLIEGLLALM